jgi:hypothetical protein
VGTWGPGIFADDYAADLRGELRDLIGQKVSAAEATERLIAEYELDTDPDDGPVFWLALAAAQWQLGRLEDSVRARALDVITNGVNLHHWEQQSTPSDVRKRLALLEKLREQLLTPASPPKRVPARYVMETEFQAGDLVRHRLLSGRDIVLRVVRIQTDKGGNYPEIEVLNWIGDSLPSFEELASAAPRRPLSDPDGRSQYKTRFQMFRRPKRDYPTARLQSIARRTHVPPLPPLPTGPEWVPRTQSLQVLIQPHAAHPDYGVRVVWWRDLDAYLRDGFGLE